MTLTSLADVQGATPAAETETAADLLRALNGFCLDGTIALRLDFRRLNQMDSPVAVEADSNIWIYGLLALVGVVYYFVGWQASLGVFIAGTVAYFTIGRRYVHQRVEKRVRETALTDTTVWQKLWRFGGVTLVTKTRADCAAPGGNWIGLVRTVRSGSTGTASATGPATS